jgi:C-terminal processing protease CtpA/Prc
MIPLLEEHYLDPAVARVMIAALREPARREGYARISLRHAFGRKVTDDLRAISHDMHVILHYEPPRGPAAPSDTQSEHDREVAANAGFAAVERRAGNVAYVRLDTFGPYADGVDGEAAYAARMAKVADADALILDLRQNYGGYPEMVALLVSYLTDAPAVHLVDFWDHDDGSTTASWTRQTVAGPRFGGKKPVYVLISKETFSGGEEAAYDLRALERAVLVGERTGGGGNFAPHHAISPHFTFAVPQGRAVSAITGKGWEGVGVEPDVPVPADEADKVAMARATAQKGR